MKIISRNINWIRATMKKWFSEFFEKEAPDILCLQEIKAYEEQIPSEVFPLLKNYKKVWNPAQKPWYAWTAIFYHEKTICSEPKTFSSIPFFSQDWRIIELEFQHNGTKYTLFNLYFPNGSPRANGESMLEKKLEFYDAFLSYVDKIKALWTNIILSGDFNVCHKEIDLAQPKNNKRAVWFLPEEREKIDKIIKHWFIDVFRHFYPTLEWAYTRWSYRTWIKERNLWRRYDYFFVNSEIISHIQEVKHFSEIRASDHCPLLLTLK